MGTSDIYTVDLDPRGKVLPRGKTPFDAQLINRGIEMMMEQGNHLAKTSSHFVIIDFSTGEIYGERIKAMAEQSSKTVWDNFDKANKGIIHYGMIRPYYAVQEFKGINIQNPRVNPNTDPHNKD